MDVLAAKRQLDDSNDYHIARLLLILDTFTDEMTWLKGITKLVKLDFLLRYPTYLEHALEVRRESIRSLDIQDHERSSIESSMVRYRYGPWDARYRSWVNILVARGLLEISVSGRTVQMRITPKGAEVASQVRDAPEFAIVARRASVLRSHLDLTATGLTRFIYQTFPALSDMRFGEEIT